MSVFATLTLKVTVELDTDQGINTTSAYEPPYDYLAVRDVEWSELELQEGANAAAVALIGFGGTEDLDPDGLLVGEVGNALATLAESHLED